LVKRYSPDQIDQGLTQLFARGGMDCEQWVFAGDISLEARIHCIQSIFDAFERVLAGWPSREAPSSFFMWWDNFASAFWSSVSPVEAADAINEDARKVLDTMFDTLIRILKLPDRGCQICALHGLGHLRHPGVPAAIDQYRRAPR